MENDLEKKLEKIYGKVPKGANASAWYSDKIKEDIAFKYGTEFFIVLLFSLTFSIIVCLILKEVV